MNDNSDTSFYMMLPSNASMGTYKANKPGHYTVVLPNRMHLEGSWQVALADIIYPHTWHDVNLPLNRNLFYAKISSARSPTEFRNSTKYPDQYWVPIHLDPGHYTSLDDLLRNIQKRLQQTFGEPLANHEFQFAYQSDRSACTITLKKNSCLALNPYMIHEFQVTASSFPNMYRRMRNFHVRGYEPSFSYHSRGPEFLALGKDESVDWSHTQYNTYNTDRFAFSAVPLTSLIHWYFTATCFQSIYVYTDIVASSIVGDTFANILRIFPAAGEAGDIVNPPIYHRFYVDLRVNSINTIEIMLTDTTGKAIEFQRGQVQVTLHFKKKNVTTN